MKKLLDALVNEIDLASYCRNSICISFVGGPGHGKTTVSKILCQKLNLFHCSNDYIARKIEAHGITFANYEERTKLVSSLAFPYQDFLFKNKIGFVLDANLMLYLDILKKRCEKYNYKLFIIELLISQDEALKRSLRRLHSSEQDNLSTSDQSDFELFQRQYEDYKKLDTEEYIFTSINMESDDAMQQVDEVVAKIKGNIS